MVWQIQICWFLSVSVSSRPWKCPDRLQTKLLSLNYWKKLKTLNVFRPCSELSSSLCASGMSLMIQAAVALKTMAKDFSVAVLVRMTVLEASALNAGRVSPALPSPQLNQTQFPVFLLESRAAVIRKDKPRDHSAAALMSCSSLLRWQDAEKTT